MAVRNISASDEVFEEADKEAQRLGLSFSAFVRLLLSQYFNGIRFERRREETSVKEG